MSNLNREPMTYEETTNADNSVTYSLKPQPKSEEWPKWCLFEGIDILHLRKLDGPETTASTFRGDGSADCNTCYEYSFYRNDKSVKWITTAEALALIAQAKLKAKLYPHWQAPITKGGSFLCYLSPTKYQLYCTTGEPCGNPVDVSESHEAKQVGTLFYILDHEPPEIKQWAEAHAPHPRVWARTPSHTSFAEWCVELQLGKYIYVFRNQPAAEALSEGELLNWFQANENHHPNNTQAHRRAATIWELIGRRRSNNGYVIAAEWKAKCDKLHAECKMLRESADLQLIELVSLREQAAEQAKEIERLKPVVIPCWP